MEQEIEISGAAIQYFATVGGVFIFLLLATWIVQRRRPSQVEAERKQGRKRRGLIDSIMDDGMTDHIESVHSRDNQITEV